MAAPKNILKIELAHCVMNAKGELQKRFSRREILEDAVEHVAH